MTIIYGILGLGLLVFLHELGHCLAARGCGVTVESFSLGMGPVLLHKTWRGTDWRISLIPLGGYCGMKGEQDYRKALEENRPQIGGDKDSFYGTHPFKRIIIAFSGPFFNLLFGVVAFTVVALIGYTYYSAGTTVTMADEVYTDMQSPAHEAGMQTGDTITHINGKPMEDFSEIASYVGTHPGEALTITLERNGETLALTVHTALDKATGSGRIGIVASADSVAERLYPPRPLGPALVEGLRKTGELVGLTVKSIGILFQGVQLSNALSGPARITTMLGDTVRQGFSEGIHSGVVSTLEFLALISVSLFLTNLLPVPVLDGGLILFAAAEMLFRRHMHPKVLYCIQMAGAVCIAALMALAIGSDIHYFIMRK
ncbi:MAG: site-2 protease family protein [Treponema sp.]|nr:site-2 protease family protein [Treponema sp.]